MSSIASPSHTQTRNCPGDAALQSYYLYPAGLLKIQYFGEQRSHGFFRFGEATCFGGCALPDLPQAVQPGLPLPDAMPATVLGADTIGLPFDPSEIADQIRLERYTSIHSQPRMMNSARVRSGYYRARRFIPAALRRRLQRTQLADWHEIPFPRWPVDRSVDLMFEEVLRLALKARGGAAIPFVWFWPDGGSACMMMTHDVEYATGRDFCAKLMKLDETAGLRSSFQLIPEGRYEIPPSFLEEIRRRGHEVNIHDLNHDGHLFSDRELFLRRAEKIRVYAARFGAEGFRSGALYRNLEWYDALDFSYDMSVPNVAHLDPQRGGCCTVMPYFIGNVLELPITATQEYSLFYILQDYSLALWEQQMDTILGRHGLLSFSIHPDYIRQEPGLAVYVGLLSRLATVRSKLNVWVALPAEVNQWWRRRSCMEIVGGHGTWRITGEGSERARLAYASLDGDRLVYRLES